ncbi:hypothetical protein IKO70_04300 [bacterium]|nr:hypothetical protein [bacterium]
MEKICDAETLVLFDFIRELGYENPGKLANWVREIIKNKEDFDKRFHVPSADSFFNRREDKFMLAPEAKILVENLCFLKPYMSCFGKSLESQREFQPYRVLGGDKADQAALEKKFERLRMELQAEKERNERAMANLEYFHSILVGDKLVDITEEKLVKEKDEK